MSYAGPDANVRYPLFRLTWKAILQDVLASMNACGLQRGIGGSGAINIIHSLSPSPQLVLLFGCRVLLTASSAEYRTLGLVAYIYENGSYFEGIMNNYMTTGVPINVHTLMGPAAMDDTANSTSLVSEQ